MTAGDWASWAQAFFGLATFGAACIAVKAAYDAPKRAAEFAETLRADAIKADEDRRLKLLVFTNLMQFRAQILNPTAIASLNLIDVVYRDHREVREAWRYFLSATAQEPHVVEVVHERYRAIIEKMARALGLDADITVEDVKNIYYPKGQGELDEVAHLELQEKLKRLRLSDGAK